MKRLQWQVEMQIQEEGTARILCYISTPANKFFFYMVWPYFPKFLSSSDHQGPQTQPILGFDDWQQFRELNIKNSKKKILLFNNYLQLYLKMDS